MDGKGIRDKGGEEIKGGKKVGYGLKIRTKSLPVEFQRAFSSSFHTKKTSLLKTRDFNWPVTMTTTMMIMMVVVVMITIDSWGSSFITVTGNGTNSRFSIFSTASKFLFAITSRLALETTQPHIKWVPWLLWPERKTNFSVELYLHFSIHLQGVLLKQRDEKCI
jgi:hypothetical protein